MRQLRNEGKGIVVTGCMASVQADEVLRKVPDALVIPPARYPDFETLVESRFGAMDTRSAALKIKGITAIVPISQGCQGSCSYCITRLARGSLVSRPLEQVLAQVKEALGAGAKEIYLTCQDTGCYGYDLGTSFAELLRNVCRLEGEFRTRAGMMNPDSLKDIIGPLAEAFRNEKVYKFLHLPVQSGSDEALRRMKRAYTVGEFEDLVSRFRRVIPKLTLSTDVITGFPGETEKEHVATMELLRRIRPNIVNVTRFSARPGTDALAMDDQVVSRLSKERSREMARLRFEIAKEINEQRVGEKTYALVSEKGKGDSLICRDPLYTPIVIKEHAILGELKELEVVGHAATHLFGRLV
jgi:MiaB-like tRNA modifying enzyme